MSLKNLIKLSKILTPEAYFLLSQVPLATNYVFSHWMNLRWIKEYAPYGSSCTCMKTHTTLMNIDDYCMIVLNESQYNLANKILADHPDVQITFSKIIFRKTDKLIQEPERVCAVM